MEHVGEVRLRGLVGNGVDGAPGGQRGYRHLGHQRQRLVPVQRAGEQIGRLDEEGQRAAAQAFQLAQPGRLDGQSDAVRGELKAQGLLVRVPAGCFGRDAEGTGEPALDLERDRDDGAHPRVAEERYGTWYGGEVLVDRGHPGGAVAARSGLDGDPGEALASRGKAGRRPYLQLRLVVGGQQQESGIRVEHVAGPLDRALQQSVEVVGGGRTDEDLERVRGAILGRCVGDRCTHRALEHGPLVVANEEADRGRFALGVADSEMGGVDGDDASVGSPDAVTALPSGEPQGIGDAGVRARCVRPGREVGELLAGDLLGSVSEQEGGVVVPRGDGAGAVDLDDGDTYSLVGDGEQLRGQDGTRRADAHGAVRKVELEPDLLVRRRVLDSPAGSECGAEQQAAAAFPVRAAEVQAGALERDLAFRIVVGDLDAHAVLGAQAEHIRGGARVHHRVGHKFTGEDDGVIDDVGVPHPCRVSRTNARAVATERPTGSKVAAARAVITALPIWCLVASPSPVPVYRRFDSPARLDARQASRVQEGRLGHPGHRRMCGGAQVWSPR